MAPEQCPVSISFLFLSPETQPKERLTRLESPRQEDIYPQLTQNRQPPNPAQPNRKDRHQRTATMVFDCCLCQEGGHRASRTNCVIMHFDNESPENSVYICADCFNEQIVPQIHESLTDPSKYPFHFDAQTPIRFQDYEKVIKPEDFKELSLVYERRKVELEADPKERVYCDRDGAFLDVGGEGKGDLDGGFECRCGRRFCALCKSPQEAGKRHVCEANKDGDQDAFKGLTPGKDYQLCPGCSSPYFLGEGCNSVTCRNCRVGFCMICGVQVKHGDKEHWMPPGCPRFGTRNSAAPIFDDEVNIADADDDAAVQAARDAEDRRIINEEWPPLFRARVEPAREILQELIRNLGPLHLNPYAQRVDDLALDLSVNYELFNIPEGKELGAIPMALEGQHWRAIEARHRRILGMRDYPQLERVFAEFPRLRNLWLWYLNHVGMSVRYRQERGNVRREELRLVYGDPAQEAPLQGQW